MANDEGISKPPLSSALSPARLAANRRNAQKSTGPKTKAGKRRVALNARRLGLAPPEIERQLRARGEDPRDFRRLHRDVADLFPAQDATGEVTVQLLAMIYTSGTSGEPKGVCLNVRNLDHMLACTTQRLDQLMGVTRELIASFTISR